MPWPHTTTYSASYDAAGNMLCRAPTNGDCTNSGPTAQQLGYDNEGRLISWQNAPSSPTSTASFFYDGEGNRVLQQSTTNGTTTAATYIGSLEEVSTTGANTTTTAYYYFNGHRIGLSVNGTISYLASDLLGSAEVALNSSGSATASVLYGPYGGARYTNGAMPTDYVFTGQRGDATTGLDYYGARYYDPTVGQFISADSADAGGLNRYAYVHDDPETLTDPSGHVIDCGTTDCGAGPPPPACKVNCGGSSGGNGGDNGGSSGGGGTGGHHGNPLVAGKAGNIDNTVARPATRQQIHAAENVQALAEGIFIAIGAVFTVLGVALNIASNMLDAKAAVLLAASLASSETIFGAIGFGIAAAATAALALYVEQLSKAAFAIAAEAGVYAAAFHLEGNVEDALGGWSETNVYKFAIGITAIAETFQGADGLLAGLGAVMKFPLPEGMLNLGETVPGLGYTIGGLAAMGVNTIMAELAAGFIGTQAYDLNNGQEVATA